MNQSSQSHHQYTPCNFACFLVFWSTQNDFFSMQWPLITLANSMEFKSLENIVICDVSVAVCLHSGLTPMGRGRRGSSAQLVVLLLLLLVLLLRIFENFGTFLPQTFMAGIGCISPACIKERKSWFFGSLALASFTKLSFFQSTIQPEYSHQMPKSSTEGIVFETSSDQIRKVFLSKWSNPSKVARRTPLWLPHIIQLTDVFTKIKLGAHGQDKG